MASQPRPPNIVQHFPGGDTSQPADYITYEIINGVTYTWRLDFTWAASRVRSDGSISDAQTGHYRAVYGRSDTGGVDI